MSESSVWNYLTQIRKDICRFCVHAFLHAMFICLTHIHQKVLKPLYMIVIPRVRNIYEKHLKFWLMTGLEPVICLYFIALKFIIIILLALWDDLSSSSQWVLKLFMLPYMCCSKSLVKRRIYWKRRTENEYKFMLYVMTDSMKSITCKQGYCIKEISSLPALHVKFYYRAFLFKYNETRLDIEHDVYCVMKRQFGWNFNFLRIRFQ